MSAHELAQILLSCPDLPIYCGNPDKLLFTDPVLTTAAVHEEWALFDAIFITQTNLSEKNDQ